MQGLLAGASLAYNFPNLLRSLVCTVTTSGVVPESLFLLVPWKSSTSAPQGEFLNDTLMVKGYAIEEWVTLSLQQVTQTRTGHTPQNQYHAGWGMRSALRSWPDVVLLVPAGQQRAFHCIGLDPQGIRHNLTRQCKISERSPWQQLGSFLTHCRT